MFRGKYERARAFQQEQMKGQKLAVDEEDLENVMEKNDTLAMILAGLLTFLPAALIALAIICLAGWLFIVRR
ncbi:MAG: hypothetical protein IKP86_08890 [Anaerolineaceae bacterium]|nr:hypothetical protein [Anaerolineaceae bacterium]